MKNPVGFHRTSLVDEKTGTTYPLTVMYPAASPENTVRLSPNNIAISIDAAPKEGTFPLVLISHGSGSAPLAYRTIAHHLVQNGFIVGIPEHAFDNRENKAHSGTISNLEERPKHLQAALAWFFQNEKFAGRVIPNAVSLIGHSMGGYAALALAGGVPTSLPEESPDGLPHRLDVAHSPFVKALVLLAPATVWFREVGALSAVDVPILMLVGEKDEVTPAAPHAQIVQDGVPDKTKLHYRLIENAGHYSFLSPFPEARTNAAFAPSQDPPGFDRMAFLNELNAEILEFLRQI